MSQEWTGRESNTDEAERLMRQSELRWAASVRQRPPLTFVTFTPRVPVEERRGVVPKHDWARAAAWVGVIVGVGAFWAGVIWLAAQR